VTWTPQRRAGREHEQQRAQLGHDARRPILMTGATGQQVGAALRHRRAHSIKQLIY
jgi:hypothetical protein